MLVRFSMTLALVFVLLAACGPSVGAPPAAGGPPPTQGPFEPPIGIPAPEFGIAEKLEDYYTRPDPWDQETPGWYYVDQYHPDASDANAYGTPATPRATLPNPIPAGSVVEVHGRYDYAPAGYEAVQAEGTAEAPIFIVGDDPSGSGPALVTQKWVVKSSYTILEGFEFTDRGKVNFVYPSHHVALRNSELHHIAGKIGGGGRSDAERVHHIVIYNNKIHSQDGWDQNPDVDLDNHGIKFGSYTEDVWVLDNVGYHNGGNFIQIGDWGDGSTEALNRSRRFYVARNDLYANRQSPIGVKQATDVIISENVLHDNREIQSNAAGQSGIVFQYGPERVWILFNRIYNSNAGITAGSNSGGTGQEQYIIGNVIYDIAVPPDSTYNPDTGWAPAAIMLAGGRNRHVVDNTIWNVDGGIHSPGGDGSLQIHGNLVANVRKGRHVFVELGNAVSASRITGNVFFQTGGAPAFRLGSTTYTGVAELDAAAQASDNLETDPRLADPEAGDLRPQAASPLIDSGSENDAYQRFFDLYGIDIRRDAAGTPRPQGAAWDRGAYEYVR